MPDDVSDSMHEWFGILQTGERIIWQGRPSGQLRLRLGDYPIILFGLFFSGFALFWMSMASRAGGGFWMFGLIHFSAGLALTTAPLIWRPFIRRRTFYTLTDRRAMIASDLPVRGRRLDIYPIDRMSKLSLDPGSPGSVWFARKSSWATFNRSAHVGFELIPDAARVFGLIARQEEKQA